MGMLSPLVRKLDRYRDLSKSLHLIIFFIFLYFRVKKVGLDVSRASQVERRPRASKNNTETLMTPA